MRMITRTFVLAALGALIGCGGGDDVDPFADRAECDGAPIAAFTGAHPQVISKLAIGAPADGFDLDGDGEPDNKLAAVSSIAMASIEESLASYDIIIPVEFFDLQAAAKDSCVKFAIYLGDYVTDTDGDGEEALVQGGDCNDHELAIKPGNPEVADNFRDDDCDGLADEVDATPSTDAMDRDGDGQTIADGDCDDTLAAVKLGTAEICGDGLDNDCDGVADRTGDETTTACSPFDPATQAEIPLDPLSLSNAQPVIAFDDGTIKQDGADFVLEAGPSIFSVNIPIELGISLDLRITGARIEAKMVDVGGTLVMQGGRLGGVIDSKTADTIRGLEVEQIGLSPENSLLDATFANLLGPLLALPKAKDAITAKYDLCRTPDIDVDRDGLEAFCDSNPDDEVKTVDVCVDGDGTEFTDMGTVQCTEAMREGKYRFVDGISVELNFETSPIKAIQQPR